MLRHLARGRFALRPLLALALLLIAGVATAADRPHVLLVSIDTLRADHLSIYGSELVETPHIDALAERGLLFEDVNAPIGKTGPSMASAFSGLYPPTHGARRNGVPIRPDVPLFAELLRDVGYRTGAFISNWTLRDRLSGLARGWQTYDEEFKKRRYGVGPTERPADQVFEAALPWLREAAAGGDPLLLWVHLSEPHTPYEMHAGFEVAGPPGRQPTPAEAKRLRYRSEVAYTDHMVGRLLDAASEAIDLEQALVIFLADHGESIGEHDYWGHGRNTHWANLRVPLMLAGPGVPKGARSAQSASLIDFLPTTLGLLGIGLPTVGESPPPALAGRDLMQIWNEPEDRQIFAVGDRSTATGKKSKAEFQDPLQISLITRGTKTIFDFERRRTSYYDLEADPLELKPAANPPLELEPPLRRILANWYRSVPKYDQANGELSEEDRKQLESLGYIGGD